MSLAIEAKNLSKSFSKNGPLAVDNLDLSISRGESVAFLGPNGAGNSTTIKMLCGILVPDKGESKILDFPSGSKNANLNLGLVFGARTQLYFHMTVQQCLELQAETYFVPRREVAKQVQKLSQFFSADHLLKKRVRELSLGERMRCEIVASLIHKPKVILLDEPTIGLDIVAKLTLRENLRAWQKEEKTTLLLTSHDLSDVEALCDRCILINGGKKAFDGKLKDVKGALSDLRRVTLLLKEASGQPKTGNSLGFKELPSKNPFEKCFEFSLTQTSVVDAFKFIGSEYGDALEDIQITGATLEEVIHQRFSLKAP